MTHCLWVILLAVLLLHYPRRLSGAPAQKHFRLALPGYRFAFPRDHGSHPPFATEWWYYTGHLKAEDGRRFGYQLTWFRSALSPEVKRRSAWATRDIFFAHFALTDETGRRFLFSDKIGRGALGLAGATSGTTLPRIFIGDWNLQFGGKKGERQSIQASAKSDATLTKGQEFSLNLKQINLKNPAIQGVNGVSQKSSGRGQASHYYSLTRIQTTGTLTLDGQKMKVSGQSWFDHEFGSSQMGKDQIGWDWFSLQLSDGRELMLYQLRLKDGRVEPLSSGTLVEQNGRTQHLKLSDFKLTSLATWKSPETGASYPVRWKVELPRFNLQLEVSTPLENQELRPRRSGLRLSYWEGSVRARGSQNGHPIEAVGYLEMTGYANPFRSKF